MKCLVDWFYIIINIQTLWTNLIIRFLNNLNGQYQQEIIRELHNILIYD